MLIPGRRGRLAGGHRGAPPGASTRHAKFAAALAERGHTVTAGAELTHSRGTKQVRTVDGELHVTEGRTPRPSSS